MQLQRKEHQDLCGLVRIDLHLHFLQGEEVDINPLLNIWSLIEMSNKID